MSFSTIELDLDEQTIETLVSWVRNVYINELEAASQQVFNEMYKEDLGHALGAALVNDLIVKTLENAVKEAQ
jgi:hypothetical protein